MEATMGGKAQTITLEELPITADDRRSTLATCMNAAPDFLLDRQAGARIVGHLLETVRAQWHATCEEANLSGADRNLFWERMFLNPFIFEGYDGP